MNTGKILGQIEYEYELNLIYGGYKLGLIPDRL